MSTSSPTHHYERVGFIAAVLCCAIMSHERRGVSGHLGVFLPRKHSFWCAMLLRQRNSSCHLFESLDL